MKEGKFFEQKQIHRRPIMIGEGVGNEDVNSRPSARGLSPSSVYTDTQTRNHGSTSRQQQKLGEKFGLHQADARAP